MSKKAQTWDFRISNSTNFISFLKKLKLVEDAMPLATDDKDTAEDKRNVMTSSVSRYYREASRIIANTGKGQFPNNKK